MAYGYIVALVIAYVVCGLLAYGITFAYWQGEFPGQAAGQYREDMGIAMVFGMAGPGGLFISFFASGLAQHGLKFR